MARKRCEPQWLLIGPPPLWSAGWSLGLSLDAGSVRDRSIDDRLCRWKADDRGPWAWSRDVLGRPLGALASTGRSTLPLLGENGPERGFSPRPR